MVDDFTWTRNRHTGGYFRCPTPALPDMAALGWEPSDAPREPNPAVDERLAWEAEQAAAKAETKSNKPRRGESE